MSVQNFLEDEDYESEVKPTGVRSSVGSSVPDFLQDEDYDVYDDADSDNSDGYYGGGFSDGVEPSSQQYGDSESFDYLDEDEEELFDGVDPFYAVDAVEVVSGNEPSYSVSESIVEPETEPVASSVSGVSVVTPAVNTDVDTVVSELYSSVPNFLEDEDDDESPSLGSPSSSNSNAGKLALNGAGSGGSSNVATSESAGVSNGDSIKPRRDLSKRPSVQSTPSVVPVLEDEDTVVTSSHRDVTAVTSVDNASSVKSTPIVSESVPNPSVSFNPKVTVGSLTEDEVVELKSPSTYAVNRDLKYTALKQKDATVRKVGSDGLTPHERGRIAKVEGDALVRTPSNGRLSREELLFYANLGAQRSVDFGGLAKKKLFTPPMLEESEEQRKARQVRINRALAGGSIARGAKTRLTDKDYRVLQFIAIFKFVSERQVGKLLQVAEHSAYKRLNGLRKHGLTKSFKTLGVKGSVWVLTETGMDLSGFDVPRGGEAGLTLSMVSHQFTVNHVAAHLWSGGANVLREKNFPQRNLPDGSGGFNFGERLISELQIQSAFGKVRGNTKADAYVPQIRKHMANLFDDWQRAGGVDYGPSPELIAGNEHMWTLFPPISNRLNYHVPDLVVARPRNPDGSPQSIAVEVELRTKSSDSSYENTLDAYRADDRIFKKVVWICRLKGTAEKLSRIAKRNGLADQGRISIVPIYMEDGSRFTGRDTWSL